MESSPMIIPGSGYVSDAPSATTTLVNTVGAVDGEGLSFSDVLDTINPLQHLPIVSTLYREATGADIKTLPNLIGGAIFGGIFGLIGAAVDSVVKEASGATIGHHLLAAVGLADDKEPDVTVTDMATGQVVPDMAEAAAGPANTIAANAMLASSSIMLDEATGQPADFAAERGAMPALATNMPLQRSLVHPAALQTGTQPDAAQQQPTDFFRSLQRANFSHKPARPLQTLSTIETSAVRHTKTATTAAGATANNAVAVEPMPQAAAAPPVSVGAPISILPQVQASAAPNGPATQLPTVADAQAALKANPDGFRSDMMAALQKYEAMRGADTARQLSITQ
jgi:hypothetical protein